jgi:hypothetical protein
LGKLFVVIGNNEQNNKMALYMMDQEGVCYQNLLLLWWLLCCSGENVLESFLFMLHHQETLPTVLLNSLKKQEVCMINVQRDMNSIVLCLHRVCDLWGNHTENILV